MVDTLRPLAVVTGASTGIGFELAGCCVRDGYDLVIVANEPEIHAAQSKLSALGATVEAFEADLATPEGCEQIYAALKGRPVAALLANAGVGLGKGFLDQEFEAWSRVVDTNVMGTLYLIQKIGRDMRARREGKILITGSIAGFMPGTYQAVYNGSKAFLDSFSFALRHEIKESGVTVTCLMPGATETEFFETAGMLDTKISAGKKDSPEKVARDGFKAMLRGDGDIVSGWHNKLQTMLANVMPASALAEAHKKKAAPGSARQ